MAATASFETISTMLRTSAEAYSSKAAIEDGTKRLSYLELHATAREAARALIAHGVEPGDRIAVWAPNVWEWIPCALGIHLAGATLVPINTRYKGAEAAYLLSKSRAKILFAANGFLGTDYIQMLRRSAPDLCGLQKVVVLRGDSAPGAASWTEFLSDSEAVSEATLEARLRSIAPDAISDIMFTSGTTGRPKGVVATHQQSLEVFRTWSEVVGLQADDRYLVVAPFFHTFGYKAGWLAALMKGATIVPHAVFDAAQVLARIGPDRISVLPGPPTLYESILSQADLGDYDLSSLRLAVTGAAIIPVDLVERMKSVLGFSTVITGYGLTESTGVVTMCRYDDDIRTIAKTSGRAIPGVEVKVVDDAGAELPRGKAGEVWVRGANVMRGYFEDPDATAQVLTPEGWLQTGDIGVLDGRAYLKITDRKKDMYIVGGFNVYPAEVEQDLRRHPSIQQASVVGIPDQRLGEVGCAFVVKTSGAELDGPALIAWARQEMANFKVPRKVVFVEALPLNASGKVKKFELRSQVV